MDKVRAERIYVRSRGTCHSFQSPWIRFARRTVRFAWKATKVFQSPWIRFAQYHIMRGREYRFVSIPVDKVRAEELFSAPPSNPNADVFQSPWIRFAQLIWPATRKGWSS